MRKVRVVVHVHPKHVEALRALAQTHRLPLGRMAALKLEQALEEEQSDLAVNLFLPAVEAAIRREVARAANRLAHLLARSAAEASTTRRLVYRQLMHEGRTEDEVRRLHNELWYRSVEGLKKPMAEIAEIVRAAGIPSPAGDDRTP